jgi:hypothetical protein
LGAFLTSTGCAVYKEVAVRPAELPRAAPFRDQTEDRWVTTVGGDSVLLSGPVASVTVRTTDPPGRQVVTGNPVKAELEGSALTIRGFDVPRRHEAAAIEEVVIKFEDRYSERRTAGITLLGIAGGLALTEAVLAGALWRGDDGTLWGGNVDQKGTFIIASIPIGISALGCLIPGIVLTAKSFPPRRPVALVPDLRIAPGGGTLHWSF